MKKINEDIVYGSPTGGGNINGSIYAMPTPESKIGTSNKWMSPNNVPMYANDKFYRYKKKKKKKIEERIEEYLKGKGSI